MNGKKDKQIRALQTHHDMMTDWMSDPAFKAEYDSLEKEFQLLKEMLRAKKCAGLTQEDVAKSIYNTYATLSATEVCGNSLLATYSLKKLVL